MNFFPKAFVLTCCICLVLSIFFIGCETSGIPAEEIPISIVPCQDDPEGDISFENVTLTEGFLSESYYVQIVHFKKGDPCFFISGQIKNNTSIGYWVAHHATGYDDAGNQVAFTLDSGPMVGIAQIYIEAASTENFTLHLSWSDNVSRFTLRSQKSAIMFP